MYADIAAVAHATEPDTTDRSEVVVEDASDEIRAKSRFTRRAADTALNLAWAWNSPGCGKLWHQVRSIFPGRVVCDGTIHLDDDQAREATEVVLGSAPG